MRKLNDELNGFVENIVIEDLKNQSYVQFNEENFMHKANDQRFYDYLYSCMLKYVANPDMITDRIITKNISGNRDFSGIFYQGGNISCVVPVRETMFDEMVNIHEIAHLIACFTNLENEKSILREIIPFFNEYEYLKRIHPFYAECYEKYRLNNAIRLARHENVSDDELPEIYAYSALEKKKKRYNINSLNKLNARSKKLEKKLEFKGYTIV